jgi:hypothetical protein
VIAIGFQNIAGGDLSRNITSFFPSFDGGDHFAEFPERIPGKVSIGDLCPNPQ